MKTTNIIERLNDLIQLDIDATHAYQQAIDRIDVAGIAEDLEAFKGDHERHVDELSAAVRRLGGQPPKRSRDFKGYLIEGFTALRSITGTKGALEAMRANEKTTNKKYDQALSETLPPDIAALVQRNRDDERRHLQYIENALTNRTWELGATQPRA